MRLNAGWVTCSVSAAMPRLPASTMARNARSWRGSRAITQCYDFSANWQWSGIAGRRKVGIGEEGMRQLAGQRVQSETTVREAVFELLRSFGLTTVFGNPGSTELPMFRDFPADFRYVLALQESLAVGMADGYAQATRNAGLVSLHSAVGVGHALGNIFTAYRNQTPLLITAGQQARSILPYEPFLYSERATELPRPYVKWSCEPARAEDVPVAMARAYYEAMQAPQGPVLVSVPVDDWQRRSPLVAPRVVSRRV